jgi:hypothetical protein
MRQCRESRQLIAQAIAINITSGGDFWQSFSNFATHKRKAK